MKLTDALVLASDVLVISTADLPQAVRDELGDEDAHAVTRARGRSPSVLVDDGTAQLLAEFRRPSTIVEAVIRLGRSLREDPETLLTRCYPTLRQFLFAGHLVSVDSRDAQPHERALAVGERIAGGVVVRCVRVLDDTEVYQLAMDSGVLAALKLIREDRSQRAHALLRREAEFLVRVEGGSAPRLLGQGQAHGRPWVCMEWCEGVPVVAAAAGMRRRADAAASLLTLCQRVAEAYCGIHARGVVHADVHPGNVLTSPDGGVRLIDFGLARDAWAGASQDEPPRGGVQAFFDPQYVAALRSRRPVPPASFESDQFSLGAVLYRLVTGADYLDFALDKEEMLRQTSEDAALSFTRRGQPAWPELEAVLARALSKEPCDRFSTTYDLLQALRSVTPRGATTAETSRRRAATTSGLQMVLGEVLANARPGGEWFDTGIPAAPFASVAYGAAGLAAALCRVSVGRADPALVSLADEWVVRAARSAGDPDAFTSSALDVDESRTGLVSPFHRRSGVHAVQALVSSALGDALARQTALRGFVAESRQACDNLDLALGRSGTLLAAALILESVGADPDADTSGVRDLGDATLHGIWAELDAMPPIPDGGPIAHLGVAHGWAGLLLATLRWCRASGSAHPPALDVRLDELAGLGQAEGLGTRWPWIHRPRHTGHAATMPGWCNGSAGFVHLWASAHKAMGDERWGVLAERAAWDTYATPTKVAQLCCGLAGQSYALLEMYRHSGEVQWLSAAAELGARAAAGVGDSAGALVQGSLHKGDVGIAALAADLERPEDAVMPFFGLDG